MTLHRDVRFRLLGTLEVVVDGRVTEVGGQSRTVLATLLVAAGQVVTVDSLLDVLWGDDPPSSAAGTLQSYVSRLRRILEPGRSRGDAPSVLVWDPPGYRLDVASDHVDFRLFESRAEEGRALLDAEDAAAARAVLSEAIDLWRGPALLEFADQDFARGVAVRLEQRRLVALEDRIAADLRLGRHAAVVAELNERVAGHPLQEGLRAHLALALYRSGRQAEALRTIEDARHVLREELGVEPGPQLRELESAILQQDPRLNLPPDGRDAAISQRRGVFAPAARAPRSSFE